MCTRVRGSNGNVSVRSGGCIVLDTLYTDHFNFGLPVLTLYPSPLLCPEFVRQH